MENNKTYTLQITASGRFGINNISVPAKYEGDPEKFFHDLHVNCICMGYDSILHYTPEWTLAWKLRENKRAFERIVDMIVRIENFQGDGFCSEKFAMYFVIDLFEDLGYDPRDTEKINRIIKNFGGDRVDC